MTKILLIGMGGFVGAVLRYAVGGGVQTLTRSISFPHGTMAVNVIGCFLIGGLTYLAETRSLFSANTRMFLFIGVLGAFTTFSTFAISYLQPGGLALEQGQPFTLFAGVEHRIARRRPGAPFNKRIHHLHFRLRLITAAPEPVGRSKKRGTQ